MQLRPEGKCPDTLRPVGRCRGELRPDAQDAIFFFLMHAGMTRVVRTRPVGKCTDTAASRRKMP